MYIYNYNSDEDDTAELLRELQKIKKERAEEQAKRICSIHLFITNTFTYKYSTVLVWDYYLLGLYIVMY